MLKKIFLAGALAVFFAAAPAMADYSFHLGRGLSFCGEAVPLDRGEVYQAVDQNLVLLAESKSRVWMALRRSGRYRAAMEAELNRAGVPADLIYIPLTITGLAPDYNAGGGRGPWRLKEAEAKALGLRVDGDVDERLDPVTSTQAAAKRLKSLKDAYGSWTTAMAAYLLGETLINQAAAEAGGERNFYRLYLPDGQDQLPASVLAGKAVFQDPAAFGYTQTDRGWPALSTKRDVVKAATTARALAAQYKCDYKTFRDMNPQLLTGTVPAGVAVNIP